MWRDQDCGDPVSRKGEEGGGSQSISFLSRMARGGEHDGTQEEKRKRLWFKYFLNKKII